MISEMFNYVHIVGMKSAFFSVFIKESREFIRERFKISQEETSDKRSSIDI